MSRVAFIINSLTGGGAERIMARLLTRSVETEKAAELHLILLDIEPAAYEVPPEVIVHQLDTKKSLRGGYGPLKAKLKEIGPSISVSFLTRANLLNIAICRQLGIRCVISERVNTTSHHPNTLGGRVAKLTTWLGYRHADRVIAVSAGIADDLADNYGVPREKIAVISNPIDGEMVRRRGAEPWDNACARPLVVGMGRLVPNKNFALLLEAFALSQAPGTLMIMGEGPLREELEQQAAALGIAERVEFAGFMENPFKAVAAADCYVLPSNGEGFPNGLVEAMCLGTPVVSTNCHSGPAEILDDRPYFEVGGMTECKYGILVPVNDAPSMAQAITAALAPDQKADRSARASEGASRYGLDITVGRYWEAIRG
jgi:glycosyltransferase involved in cell wall biosynthesis